MKGSSLSDAAVDRGVQLGKAVTEYTWKGRNPFLAFLHIRRFDIEGTPVSLPSTSLAQAAFCPPSPRSTQRPPEPFSQPDATHPSPPALPFRCCRSVAGPHPPQLLEAYTSLGAKKLANFLDADEEEMVQEMMVVKQASRSISRVAGAESSGLLDGQTITTSDLNFVIAENMVHIAESTVGRRYAGWFIKNTERTQKILDDLKTMPLPASKVPTQQQQQQPQQNKPVGGEKKVAWGSVKA
ncbi:hypothetical protein NMY22_g10181 [Coprinellus aureogranulatus]|nr:hypothetical protein NMY22_g10181 [Coprinellus aureogranulatus]